MSLSSSHRGWLERIVLLLLVLLGMAARLHEVTYNLDGDEIFSVKLASLPFGQVISRSLADRPHPPLHNILLHPWIAAFGASEAAVRALSIALSVGFLLASYGFLRRLMAPSRALGALSILAVSPFFVYYGQQARPYALIACLSAANLLAFLRLMEEPNNRRRLAVWALSCVLLLYAQYLAILLIACEMTFAWFSKRERRLILVWGFLACALIVPWMAVAMGGHILNARDPLPYINWIERPSLRTMGSFYWSVFGNIPGQPRWWMAVGLGCLGAAYLRRLLAERRIPSNHVFLLLVAAGVPALVYVISVWGPKPVFASRQLIGVAVAFVAIVGLCLAALPARVATAFTLVLLAWSVTASSAPTRRETPPWREIAALVDARYGSLTVATQEGWVRDALAYYRRSAPVEYWIALARDRQRDRLLFMCRTLGVPDALSLCSEVQAVALRERAVLVETWRWGTSRDSQIRLYEIARADRTHPSVHLAAE